MVKKVLIIILFLLVTQRFLFGVQPIKPKIPELAAQFSLLDLNGDEVALSDFKDKPVILFFWTTWCPFCLKELRVLKDMYLQLSKEDWELLAINIGEPTYKVDNYAKRYSLTFKVLLDKDTAVAKSYDIRGVPTFIFVDKKGYVVFKDNYFPQDTYKDLISK